MPGTRDREERVGKEEQTALEGLDLWRLCEELSVVQASLLLVGRDPGGNDAYVEAWDMDKRPPGYEAAKHAIMGALIRVEMMARAYAHVYDHYNGSGRSEFPH